MCHAPFTILVPAGRCGALAKATAALARAKIYQVSEARSTSFFGQPACRGALCYACCGVAPKHRILRTTRKLAVYGLRQPDDTRS